jgi:4-hydroxy-3-methylbut-2-enyl diphosphate reductase
MSFSFRIFLMNEGFLPFILYFRGEKKVSMDVTVDPEAGFCFGVERAIAIAQTELVKSGKLYCLEDIVHNTAELERLKEAGLTVITHADLPAMAGQRVILRAHGEPPETFAMAESLGIGIIDATCPIVAKLQERIRKSNKDEASSGAQIVIFGKKGHPEVTGLIGQTDNAVVISKADDLSMLDFSRPIRLYSQTTMDHDAFEAMAALIKARMQKLKNDNLIVNNSLCRQVAGRSYSLKEFASSFDVVIFVSDKKSSNGAFLFNVCRSANPNCYFIHEPSEINPDWFNEARSVGITGATSTPQWLMEEIAGAVERM